MKTKTVFCLVMLAGVLMALAADYPYANPKTELEKIPWLKDTARRTNQVWQTKYDNSQKETAYLSRIVSYAGKWTRHSFGGHGGLGDSCGWRYAVGPLAPRKDWKQVGQLVLNEVDVDADGDKADDFVFSLPFSMEVPLSIPDWPAANVFPERLSSTFYGGASYYCGNNTPDKSINFSSEMGINADHYPPFFDARAEDHPMNGMRHATIPDSFLRHYVTMLWKKEDFLNHGNDYRVDFDDNSRLAILCTRGYWYGWNDVRFVVQNGDTLYISETMPKVPDYPFKEAGKSRLSGYLPVCYPNKTKWAVYKPEGYHVDFDPAGATYETVNFHDVRAVGWYLAKNDNSPAQTHCKWYGFECDAVVHTPAKPSPDIEMKAVKAAALPEFYMATCELPYALWQNIYRWGDSPSHILQARYVYDKSGSMGSMGYGKREHSHDEPLTDITFYDALALCNTLSEMEGKTPCYYLDPEFKTIFKNQHIATYATLGKDAGEQQKIRNFQSPACEVKPVPKIYVNWEANGMRLPTAAEWEAAAGNLKPETGNLSSDGTRPVGSGSPNACGMYDMPGNVWELCWTFGNVYDPTAGEPVTALGGDFTGADQAAKPASPYGDTPYDGDSRIGVRLVCREAGLSAPTMDAKGAAPRWTFKSGDVVGQKKAEPVKEPVLSTVDIPGGSFVRHDKKTVQVAPFSMSKYKVTFDRWKTVRQWAEANGYDLYKNGDMGSMYFFDFTHSPEEPVTHLTWFDMITWCNALSEMEGKTPCYYEDEACTNVIRQAFAYRPIKLEGYEYIQVGGHPLQKYMDGGAAKPFIFTRWDTDGYRLPTAAEMDYAVRGGTTTKFFWGDDEGKADEYLWTPKTAAGRTHPVGQKKPNPFGLYDIQGNGKEWLFSRSSAREDVDRPYGQNLDNPISSPFYGYKKPWEVYAPIRECILAGGPSYLYGRFDVKGPHGVAVESSGETDMTHYYSDVSFRPVRCAAGTHPRDGLRPLTVEGDKKVLQVNKQDFNSLGQ